MLAPRNLVASGVTLLPKTYLGVLVYVIGLVVYFWELSEDTGIFQESGFQGWA